MVLRVSIVRPSRANMCLHAICPLSVAFQGFSQIRQISKLQMFQKDHVGARPRPRPEELESLPPSNISLLCPRRA